MSGIRRVCVEPFDIEGSSSGAPVDRVVALVGISYVTQSVMPVILSREEVSGFLEARRTNGQRGNAESQGRLSGDRH